MNTYSQSDTLGCTISDPQTTAQSPPCALHKATALVSDVGPELGADESEGECTMRNWVRVRESLPAASGQKAIMLSGDELVSKRRPKCLSNEQM